jgi:hypothetical protein
LTLALAVTGILRSHAEYIDALVALTIALIGAENIVVHTQKPKVIAWTVGSCMGFMALLEYLGYGGLPSLLLLGAGLFTANYHFGKFATRRAAAHVDYLALWFDAWLRFRGRFTAAAIAARAARRAAGRLQSWRRGGSIDARGRRHTGGRSMRKYRLALPRPIVVDVCSAFLVGLGVFWFVSRSYA